MREVISIAIEAAYERDRMLFGSPQEPSSRPPSSLAAHETECREEEEVVDVERQQRIESAMESATNLGIELDSLGFDAKNLRNGVRWLHRF